MMTSRTSRRTKHSVDGVESSSDVVNQSNMEKEEKTDSDNSLYGDRGSIALLMFLYLLQGIPLGLAGSIPMLMQSRSITYKEQALFSFVFWPFSLKLLWAPIVDSLYVRSMGRRKSWLVPIQYMLGFFMIFLSYRVSDYLGESGSGSASVVMLTVVFFMLNFLAATQDIAVDGWALTMLSRKNVGWASTCNSVGQTAGYFLGNVLFMALESANFCNNYLRSIPNTEGMVTLSGFLFFWGIVFFFTTTFIWMIKHEADDPNADQESGIISTYKQLFAIIRLPSVISYCGILLTAKIGFAATDALTSLKLIEAGLPKERLALFAVPMIPIQIALPLLISKYTAGPHPMNIFLKAMPFRILIGILYAALVYLANHVQEQPGEFPTYFYIALLSCYGLHQIAVYAMFVAQMAFNAKISDPAIGGTYMTLLNTVSNLGGNWPSTVALWLVDIITQKSCEGSDKGTCYGADETVKCESVDGICKVILEGYYIEVAICIVIGFTWFWWRKGQVKYLQQLSLNAWKCSS